MRSVNSSMGGPEKPWQARLLWEPGQARWQFLLVECWHGKLLFSVYGARSYILLGRDITYIQVLTAGGSYAANFSDLLSIDHN